MAAPSAAVAYLAEAAYPGMRLVVQLAAAACTPGTGGLAAGRQSYHHRRAAEARYEACLEPLAEPFAVQRCVALRASRLWTRRRHRWNRRARAH